jgi:RNA polymerase sigma factor (sigma-70 family)
MAEKEGFEPPVPLLAQLISSQSHSATLPLLLTKVEEQKSIWAAWQALSAIRRPFRSFFSCQSIRNLPKTVHILTRITMVDTDRQLHRSGIVMLSASEPPKVEIALPETWVDRYGDYLYGYAMSRLHDPEIAADCVQDTFMAGIKALNRFDGSRDIKFWLRGIMSYKIVDKIRQSVKEKRVNIDTVDEALLESFWFKYSGTATTTPTPWQFNPRKHYDNTEFGEVFDICIRQVKKPERDAFILRVLEDQTTDEVCRAMNISSNYLWVLLHRARLQLKVTLEANWTGKDAK